MISINDTVNHLKLLFDNNKDFVFFLKKIGNDFEYLYTNKSATQMLGRNVVGDLISEAVDEDAAKFIIANYNKTIESNEQNEFEDYAYFELTVHKHLTTVTPVLLDQNEYILAITKEIKFEEDLQDKYLFMRSVFFNTFLSTILIRSDATIMEANPAFTDNLNLNLQSIIGKKFYDLPIFTEKSIVQIQKYIQNAKNGDHFSTQMITFVDDQKRERYYIATFSPVLRGVEVAAIFIIFQDVTEYILQQKQLQTTTEGLEMFKRAVNYAAEMTVTNKHGEIIEVNDKFIERTGYTREELMGKTHNIVNSNYHPAEFFNNLWSTILKGRIWRGEVRNRTKYGETYWVDTTIIPLSDNLGEVYQYITIHFNVSDKKKMMLELRNIERTFRLITENTNDLIVVLNHHGKIIYSSPSYTRNLGYSEVELDEELYTNLLHEDCIADWDLLLAEPTKFDKDGHIEMKLRAKNGEIIWTEGNYSIVYDHLRNSPSQIIMVSREITERKQREDSLMYLAYHDSLTQLPNRRYLQKEIAQYIEAANNSFESFAVLYIDGDNFKQVNDLYGHDVGDEFLKQFGAALSRSVRKNDLLVRLGGDEFLIVISNLSRDPVRLKPAINQVVQNIQEQIAIGWAIGDISFTPTASVGIAIYPYDGITLDELVEYADFALIKGKQSGSNSVEIPYFNKQ